MREHQGQLVLNHLLILSVKQHVLGIDTGQFTFERLQKQLKYLTILNFTGAHDVRAVGRFFEHVLDH